MNMIPSNPLDTAELRRQAEARLIEKQKSQRSQAESERTAHNTQRLVQELQIHQIELELQNEQLEQARAVAEAALERFTDLYEFAPAGYFTLDLDGTIQQANLTGARLLRVDRSRLVNRRFGLFVAENFRKIFWAFVEKVFASTSQETCEALLLREGRPPFFARIEARRSGNGQECRAVVVDITESNRLEEKIQEQANLLELAHDAIFVRGLDGKIEYWNKGAEQLYGWTAQEMIDCDFGKMVHEDRGSFEATKKILLKEGSWSGEVRKLARAQREVVVASRWTLLRDGQVSRRLLTFSKGGAPIKQPLDVAEILTHATLLALSGSKVKSHFAFQRDLSPVVGDPVQLTQVIENVEINACEAMPQGGRLLARAGNADERILTASGLPAGRYVKIEIEDSGTGIPEDIRDRIFEVCFTTKPGGSGLGLATVKSIMEQHGGSISIDSRVGRGTIVSLMLPAATDRPVPSSASPPIPIVKTNRVLS
jgi:PAS domain S-box-containing protein